MDTRPQNCRFRLQDEGKSYPRSSCRACGRTVTTGLGRDCADHKKTWPDQAQRDHEYRVRYVTLGGHVHMRVFSKPRGQSTFAKLGDLVCSVDEWASFKLAFKGAEFLEEDDG